MRISGDPEDIKVGNNSVSDNRNQDNRCAPVKDVVDFDNRVTTAVDPTDGVLVDVLAHPFGLCHPHPTCRPV